MNLESTLAAVDSRRGLAMALMVLSAAVFSFDGLMLRSMEAALPWQINFYRAAALFGVVCGLVWFRFRRNFFSAIGNVGVSGCIAGVLLGCAGMTFLPALANTTVANTMFILGTIPFFTALLARIFLKEKLNRATVLTMLAAMGGLALMVFEGIAIGAGAGNGLALLTALLFAAYAVILRSRRQREMFPVLLISALCLLPVSAVVSGDLSISARDMALSFFWGGVISVTANGLFIYASRHLAAAEITLFMLLDFALAPMWVWLVFTEQPSRHTLIGGAVIILAVAARAAAELPGERRRRHRSRGLNLQ